LTGADPGIGVIGDELDGAVGERHMRSGGLDAERIDRPGGPDDDRKVEGVRSRAGDEDHVTIGKLDLGGGSGLRRWFLVRGPDRDGRLGTHLRRRAATERQSRHGVGADLEAVATSQRDAVARPERPRSVSPDDRGGAQLDRREDVTGR
jgi:hypothetical protein